MPNAVKLTCTLCASPAHSGAAKESTTASIRTSSAAAAAFIVVVVVWCVVDYIVGVDHGSVE